SSRSAATAACSTRCRSGPSKGRSRRAEPGGCPASALARPEDHGALGGHVLVEPVAHQRAELQHALVGEGVLHEQAVAAARDEAGGVELLQVLAEVALRQPGELHELAHRALAVLQRVEDGEPRRFRERAEARRHTLEQRRRGLPRDGAPWTHARFTCVGSNFTTTRKSTPITSAGTIAGTCSRSCTVMRP